MTTQPTGPRGQDNELAKWCTKLGQISKDEERMQNKLANDSGLDFFQTVESTLLGAKNGSHKGCLRNGAWNEIKPTKLY